MTQAASVTLMTKKKQTTLFLAVVAAVALGLLTFKAFEVRQVRTKSPPDGLPNTQSTEPSNAAHGSQQKVPTNLQGGPNTAITATTTTPKQGPLAAIPGKTYPVQNLNSEFSALADKATHGDMIAARTLSQAVRLCANVPKTFEELDSATANATRSNLAPNWAVIMQYDLEYKKSLFNQCVGTTPDEIATHGKWIGILAENGDAEARLEYVSVARPTDIMAANYEQQLEQYKQISEHYIQSEIDNGNPDGLLTMAMQYYDSPVHIEGIVPLYTPDNLKAYSYFYAYGLADPDSQSALTLLAVLNNQLSASQISQGTEMGVNIYNKCCRR